VPCAPILSREDLFHDQQIAANELIGQADGAREVPVLGARCLENHRQPVRHSSPGEAFFSPGFGNSSLD